MSIKMDLENYYKSLLKLKMEDKKGEILKMELDFNDLIIVAPNRQKRSRAGEDNSIYFSFSKNKYGYVEMRFYFGGFVSNNLLIDDDTKVTFAFNKKDRQKFYLIFGKQGHSLRKNKRVNSYCCVIKSPFKYVDKKMLEITNDKLIIHKKQNTIEFSVENILNLSELNLL